MGEESPEPITDEGQKGQPPIIEVTDGAVAEQPPAASLGQTEEIGDLALEGVAPQDPVVVPDKALTTGLHPDTRSPEMEADGLKLQPEKTHPFFGQTRPLV